MGEMAGWPSGRTTAWTECRVVVGAREQSAFILPFKYLSTGKAVQCASVHESSDFNWCVLLLLRVRF